jgi:hypothetical protein
MSEQKSRRDILRKTAYVVPTVLTLAARPSLASAGSGRCDSPDELEKRGKQKEEHGNSWRESESKKAKKKNGKKH